MDNKQRQDLIVRNAAKLTNEERVDLAKRILEETPVPDVVKRFAVILPIAEDIVGRKMGSSRKSDNVTIRRMVAYRLKEEGFRHYHIGQAMGVNHATVLHYVRTMENAFDEPIFYAGDIRQYVRFKEAVEEADRHVE